MKKKNRGLNLISVSVNSAVVAISCQNNYYSVPDAEL